MVGAGQLAPQVEALAFGLGEHAHEGIAGEEVGGAQRADEEAAVDLAPLVQRPGEAAANLHRQVAAGAQGPEQRQKPLPSGLLTGEGEEVARRPFDFHGDRAGGIGGDKEPELIRVEYIGQLDLPTALVENLEDPDGVLGQFHTRRHFCLPGDPVLLELRRQLDTGIVW